MDYPLLSPIKIVKPKLVPPQRSFELSYTAMFTITESDLKIEAPINTFYSSISTGPSQAVIPHVSAVTEELAETYLRFQSLISFCITNGEDINNRLRDLMLNIRELRVSKEEIMKMDFMKLRDAFSNFIKKFEPIRKEQNFSSEELGALTRLMNQFITDRNIYTHGFLRIKRPEELFVIDYVEQGKLIVRAQVNKEILESFLDASKLIRVRLSDLRRILS